MSFFKKERKYKQKVSRINKMYCFIVKSNKVVEKKIVSDNQG